MQPERIRSWMRSTFRSALFVSFCGLPIAAFTPRAKTLHNVPHKVLTTDFEVEDPYSERHTLIDLGQDQLQQYFDFPLDDWQLEAGGAIISGYNVIVCAPTGAGKTVVGEMALWYAYERNKNAAYATPLKALSNQVYAKLLRIFGKENTGISTGDISINKEAPVRVMTTEVYRNIAWRSSTPTASIMGTSELSQHAVVVLDEFHFIGEPGRGSVWEESIITSPAHTQIVGLSATLSNAPALAAWMEHVTDRKTILIDVPAQYRPVPLRYLFATKEGLYPLFRDPDAGPGAPHGLLGYRGDGIPQNVAQKTKSAKGFSNKNNKEPTEKLPRGLQCNPALEAAARKRMQKVERSIERQKVRRHSSSRFEDYDDDDFGKPRNEKERYQPTGRRMSPREERKERERLLRNEMRRSVPSLSMLLKRLEQKQLLPAIFFIFSRAGCDEAARSVYKWLKGPTDPSKRVAEEIGQFGDTDEKKRRKSRQRGRTQRDVFQDQDGRSFRASSSYITEDVFESMMRQSSPLNESFNEEGSPLSSTNWDFYSKAGLLDYREVKEVASRISIFNNDNPEIAFDDDLVEQYLFGVGSHHAGMLPAHKSFVEILFRNQLMKAVFATETLAAGINMPARTTVICSLAKRGEGSSMSLLATSNLLQMAGRAGRRGMDIEGHVVLAATPFESHEEAAQILTDPIKPITSQFTPSYALAVNLIARGEGKLDVARQLVSKSFAMWEKRQTDILINDAIGKHGEELSEVLKASAEENFMSSLVDTFQYYIDKRSGEFDTSRLEAFIEILTTRERLKSTSKTYLGATKMLELEQTTLGYLENELDALDGTLDDDNELNEIPGADRSNIMEQIDIQRGRVFQTERDIRKHPFTTIASIVNSMMRGYEDEAKALTSAFRSTRIDKETQGLNVTAADLSLFAKSAVVVQRKKRKLTSVNPDMDTSSLIEKALESESVYDDSWNDMLAITKTLVAYGCLSTDAILDKTTNYDKLTYTLTQAGINIGMLGFENALWALVAVGGAWDVTGASSRLDRFRTAMEAIENDDPYEPINEEYSSPSASKAHDEAIQLQRSLQSLTASELAGYISCIVSDGSRTGGPSIVDAFQQLTPVQQRVIQNSLLVMERLMEVQRDNGVDESTRGCQLDVSNCNVVTEWAAGCSWNEALAMSGLPPGDLARTLSRVLDAVRQLGNLPYSPIRRSTDDRVSTVSSGIHPEIRRLCRDAALAINRYPVKDPLAFEEISDEVDIDSENDVLKDDTEDDVEEVNGST